MFRKLTLPGMLTFDALVTAVRRRSLSRRLGFANSVMALITLVIAGGLAYSALYRQLEKHSAAELRAKASVLGQMLAEITEPLASAAGQAHLRSTMFGHEDLHLGVKSAGDGQLIFYSSPLAEASMGHTGVARSGSEPILWRFSASSPVASYVVDGAAADGQALTAVISLDRSRDHRLLREFIWGSALAYAMFWALLLAGSSSIARAELAPLARFSDMAVKIGSGALDHRVDIRGLPVDLNALGVKFNAMLDRIAEGMRSMADFSGDLAHELRTPLGILLGRTQLALSRPRSEAELRQVLEENVTELERLSQMVSDMLFIAQGEEATSAIGMTEVNLRDVADGVVEFLGSVADARTVTVRVTGAATVVANELLVQRAIFNLLSNAVRHADPGTAVYIVLGRTSAGAYIEVVNRGAPIPEQHLDKIFERFYRMDESRARDAGGSGLGLAIVATIAKSHAGRVTVRCSGDRETCFCLELTDNTRGAPAATQSSTPVDPGRDRQA